ncbi:MAG TPA: 8-amino-7-oxononanoate synthase [Planctomycetes bacterium]|nr:8-amino-7-oxononanoate synthase [Planctomycetaceae bacterium]HIN55283.1 8-amino-7-oxononanoate synthase [Planctomycetota bacterium]
MSNNPLHWLEDELAGLSAQHLRRELQSWGRDRDSGPICGGDVSLINFASNDYLGLARELNSPTMQTTLEEFGWGSGASPLVTGRTTVHAALESDLAAFKATERALTFPTGYTANVGTIAALVGKQDVILSDTRNHASIIDGCRLSAAKVLVYRHNDVDHLAELLGAATSHRRRLIVTDSLFSMDGDVAPLDKIAELARAHNCMLMIDEAHATGVFGEHGRGLAELFNCEDAVDVTVGTFSKALGSIGGFVAGSKLLIDWLANSARSYMFSTALPAACASASRSAVQLIQTEPHRREQLLSNAQHLRQRLQSIGLLPESQNEFYSQIVPLVVGTPEKATALSAALKSAGLLVPAIRPPTVPVGGSMLRVSLSARHTQSEMDQLVDVLTTN